MARRMIDSKARSSESIAALSFRQRDLWYGIISVADDQGRMPGQPAFIRSAVWPYDDIALAEVSSDLTALHNAGMITLYQSGGKSYLQVINWWKYQAPQWAVPSAHPSPAGWTDRIRFHTPSNKVMTENWEKPGGYAVEVVPTPEATPDENPVPTGSTYPQYLQDVPTVGTYPDREEKRREEKLTSADADKSPEIAKPAKDDQDGIRETVLQIFCEETGLRKPPPPEPNTKLAKEIGALWYSPIRQLCVMTDWQPDYARALIQDAALKMRHKSLPIATPKSILKYAADAQALRMGGGNVGR